MTAETQAEAMSPAEREARHSAAVREMFAGIARRYDLLNHVLSLNIDKRWRRKVRSLLSDVLSRDDATVLDVACGTGDLTMVLQDGGRAKVIGTDFCRPMLAIAKQKTDEASAEIPLIEADAMTLPMADACIDAITIAFGLRNLPNVDNGLGELQRILKPGGKLVVLEFSSPIVPGFRQLFNLYFRRILPLIGGAVSGSRAAYTYLPGSVAKFPDQKELAEKMRSIGFESVKYANLTGGIAAIHSGQKGA